MYTQDYDLSSIDPYLLVDLVSTCIYENDALEQYRDVIFNGVHTDGWTEDDAILDNLKYVLTMPVEFVLEWLSGGY